MDTSKHIDLPNGERGKIINTKTVGDLFSEVKKTERFLSYREVIQARCAIFEALEQEFPKIETLLENLTREASEMIGEIRWYMFTHAEKFGIWDDRYTTGTNIVHGGDGKIYFSDIHLDADYVKYQIEEGLSDGGFSFHKIMDRVICEAYACLEMETYNKSQGGPCSAEEWRNHPVYSAAVNDDNLNEKYVRALDILSRLSHYKPGEYSGWVQHGFKPEFGRPVSAGFGEAAFYPINTNTVNHSAILVSV